MDQEAQGSTPIPPKLATTKKCYRDKLYRKNVIFLWDKYSSIKLKNMSLSFCLLKLQKLNIIYAPLFTKIFTFSTLFWNYILGGIYGFKFKAMVPFSFLTIYKFLNHLQGIIFFELYPHLHQLLKTMQINNKDTFFYQTGMVTITVWQPLVEATCQWVDEFYWNMDDPLLNGTHAETISYYPITNWMTSQWSNYYLSCDKK